MKESEDTLELLKWQDIAYELRLHFVLKWIFSGIALIILIVYTCVSKLYKPGLFLIATILLYALYIGYLTWQTMRRNVLVFEGECTEVDLNQTAVNAKVVKFTIYGKSQITIKIADKNFIVPVGSGSKIKEGYIIKVYTLKDDIYVTNDNTFTINSPILTKISKR